MEPRTVSEYQSLIDELESTLPFSDAKRRASLLERVSDLFLTGAAGCSDERLAIFDDVLMRIAAEIEVKARAALARRFATLDNAPPKLIRKLAFDDAISVAAPVLAGSPQLTDADLIEAARTKSQDHLYAITRRLSLSEEVTDVLVARGDPRVVRSTARNRGARFSTPSYERMIEQARKDGGLALAMGRRNDVPRQFFLKLLEQASASVRSKLLAASPQAAEAIGGTIDAIAGDMRREARENSVQHAAALRDTKHRYAAQGLTEADVHAPARAQQFERTAIALATLGGASVDFVERALLDQRTDMILTIAKAAGCSWATAKALLLMHAAQRGMSEGDLKQAALSYERLRAGTAKRMLKFHERRTARLAAAPIAKPGTQPAA